MPNPPVRPLGEGGADRFQLDRAPATSLLVGQLQIAQQDPPGHPIDHQMVHSDEQPGTLTRPEREEHYPHHRTTGDVQAGRGGRRRLRHDHPPIRFRNMREVTSLEHHATSRGDLLEPLTLKPGKTSPQRRVMRHHRIKGHRQRVLINILRQLHREGLVEMSQWPVGGEEPVLNRGQRRRAGNHLSIGHLWNGPHTRRQRSHRLRGEHIPRGHRYTGLPSPGHHLNTEDRVPTQLEEIVLHANPIRAQHLSPDLRQNALDICPGGDVPGHRGGVPIRGRERVSVQFSGGAQRQFVECDE